MNQRVNRARAFTVAICLAGAASAQAQATGPVLADYDAVLREPLPRPDGGSCRHVDTPTLVARLQALHATTYAFLVFSACDYADLSSEFLPAAEDAGLDVWPYLAPPSEANGNQPPCQQDYICWARTLGALAQSHPHLSAFVIDDFTDNLSVYTPAYLGQVRDAGRQLAPAMKFYPISYYPFSLSAYLGTDLEGLVDGVIFPYRDLDSVGDLPNELTQMCELMKQPLDALRLSVPVNTPSNAGDFIGLTAIAGLGAPPYRLAFNYFDSYAGPTSGYHQFQVLVNGNLVWSRDIADGGTWQDAGLDVSGAIDGGATAPVEFRIYDDKGVSNSPVTIDFKDLTTRGLDLDGGAWVVSRNQAATWTAGPVHRDYAGRCILMVYTTSTSWHAALPTNAYIAAALDAGEALTASCLADGVITYALDKAQASPDFATVSSLYETWAAAPPVCPADGGVVGSADGGPDAGPDAGVAVDAGPTVDAGNSADAGTARSTSGCGCESSQGALPLALVLLVLMSLLLPRGRSGAALPGR